MVRLVVSKSMLVNLLVMTAVGVLQCAKGQFFVHFDIRENDNNDNNINNIATTTATTTASASKMIAVSALEMAARAADQQAALQVGTCSSLWKRHLSKQCPPGSFMAMRERSTTGGLGPLGFTATSSLLRCQPAGCLHSSLEVGGGEGEDYAPRDEGAILKAAVSREVHRLVEEQPGKSFDEHLTEMRTGYVQEGLEVKATLTTLLAEASKGQERTSSCTAMMFFAELARYRGFVGSEVDEAWASLREVHKKEMALALLRRAPRLLVARFGRAILNVGGEGKAKAQTIRRQAETITTLQLELSAALDRERVAREETAPPTSRLLKMLGSERVVHETKEEALTSELSRVKKLLAEERHAKGKAVMAQEALRADVIACSYNAQQAAEKKTAFHVSEVSAALDGTRAAAVTKAAELESELSEAKKLLAEERVAKEEVVAAAEGAVRAEVVACSDKVKAAQLATEKNTALHVSEVSAALDGKRVAVEKAAELASELSEAKKLLADERDRTKQLLADERDRTEKLLDDERDARVKAVAEGEKAARIEVVGVRMKARDAQQTAEELAWELSEAQKVLAKERDAIEKCEEDTVLLVTEVFAAQNMRTAAVVEAAGLESELTRVKKVLGEEREAKESAVAAEGAVRAELSDFRVETRAAQQAAGKHASLLESELCADMEREEALQEEAAGLQAKAAGLEEKAAGLEDKAAGLEDKAAGLQEEAAGLTSELSLVKQLLEEERGVMEMVLMAEDAMRAENSDLRRETREAGDATQAANNYAAVLASELSAALDREEEVVEKATGLAAELALVKHLLDKEQHGAGKWL